MRSAPAMLPYSAAVAKKNIRAAPCKQRTTNQAYTFNSAGNALKKLKSAVMLLDSPMGNAKINARVALKQTEIYERRPDSRREIQTKN
jgi:hypothetical protein